MEISEKGGHEQWSRRGLAFKTTEGYRDGAGVLDIPYFCETLKKFTVKKFTAKKFNCKEMYCS
jgi:hypothetical protein